LHGCTAAYQTDKLLIYLCACRLPPFVCPLLPLLQRTGLDQALVAASDPNYTGPQLPAQQFVLDLPWWFFGAQPTAAAAAPAPINEQPPASRPEGVPAAGPYTVSGVVRDSWVNLGCSTSLIAFAVSRLRLS
jgi:hypothetical protein